MKKLNFYQFTFSNIGMLRMRLKNSNVRIRGRLTPWILGQCPGAHHFRGATPTIHDNLKKAQIVAKISFTRGPKGFLSAPGTDRITYNEKSLKLIDRYGLDSVLIDGWTGYSFMVKP